MAPLRPPNSAISSLRKSLADLHLSPPHRRSIWFIPPIQPEKRAPPAAAEEPTPVEAEEPTPVKEVKDDPATPKTVLITGTKYAHDPVVVATLLHDKPARHVWPGRKSTHPMKHIPVRAPPPSTRQRCKDPVAAVNAAQLARLDPTGARTRLFAVHSANAIKVGDIVQVRQKGGEPFAGALLNVRRRGPDTSILLRGMLTRVPVEVWFKVYSPNVEAIELVRKREKTVRRARLTYLRLEKHDVGPRIEGWVRRWRRTGLVEGGEKETHAQRRRKV